MSPEPNDDNGGITSGVTVLWTVRSLVALFSVASVHIISFFREIEPLHLQGVTVGLTKRVVWDLYSTAVYSGYLTILYSAIIWLAWISIRVFIDVARLSKIPKELHFPGSARGGLIGVWFVSFYSLYFGNPETASRLYFMVIGFAVLAVAAIVFVVDWKHESFLSRVTSPFRSIAVQVISGVAAILWISSATGAALARQYMSTGKVTVEFEGSSKDFSLLNIQAEGLFLVGDGQTLIYLPNHMFDKVTFAPSKP